MSETNAKRNRGRTSYYAGLAAEEAVMQMYCSKGLDLVAKRWRGKGGEIDLVFGSGAARIFVEVKKSKTFAAAAIRVGPTQSRRLFAAAEEFLSKEPAGLLTDSRFDVALVDQAGRIEVLENALVTG